MKQTRYGPCGLYCGACGAQDCDGCSSDRVDDWVRQCRFRTCARERAVDACCFCSVYPCAKLHAFMHDKWPHHWTMDRNLACIRDQGVGRWLELQKQEWSCSRCGASTYWYQKTCACGNRLDAWELPV